MSTHLLSLADVEAAARAGLDPVHADYIAGGAGDELTLRENEAAFNRLRLLPRALRGNAKREHGVQLLDDRPGMPVLIAPTAFHRLAHPEGELATARAAAAAGTLMIVSMAATTAVADIAAAARERAPGGDSPLWFQLYLQPDLDFTAALVRRAAEAGCSALVVTADSAARGVHARSRRHGFAELPTGMACENMRDPGSGRPRPIEMSAEISWQHLDWLRETTSLPVLLKGLVHPADVRLALAHGVDGLVVSNHGGRQLDGVPPAVELLPEIAAEVDGRVPLILDGGVRRGTDVVKALALGATAVAVGRPVLWGLAAAGEAGVRRVLELLREEFDHAMALCGASTPQELTADLVREVAR